MELDQNEPRLDLAKQKQGYADYPVWATHIIHLILFYESFCVHNNLQF